MEGEHGRHPAHHALIQRATGPLQRLGPAGPGDDELGQQRVEGLRDGHPLRVARIHPNSRAGRPGELGDGAGGGQEVPAGVFGVDPELDRVPARPWVAVPEFLAVRDPEHLPDQIDAGDLLRHRVLDLKPGVDLEERHRAVLPDQKFTGTRAHITGLPQDGLGRPVQLLGLAGGQEWRGRLLDQLLVPALQRAVPGGDHHHVPVPVGEALGLHMPGPVQVALDEALTAAERRHGFADRGLVGLADLVRLADHLQPGRRRRRRP